MRRTARVLLSLVAAGLVLAMFAVLLVERTDVGRRVVQRRLLSLLRPLVHGELQIGHIEGNVLGDFSLVDVVIKDSVGVFFARAPRIDGRIDKRGILGKRIHLEHVVLHSPEFSIAQSRDQVWNYRRIFHSDSARRDTSARYGDWITLDDVTIRDGKVSIRRPWTVGSGTVNTDSLIAATIQTSRWRLERSGSDLQQVVDIHAIDARISHAILNEPTDRSIRVAFDSLAGVSALLRPPEIVVRQMAGTMRSTPDSVVVQMRELVLPHSEANGTVTYYNKSGDVAASLVVPRFVFADIHSVYPTMPDSATGHLWWRMLLRQHDPSEYVASRADVTIGTARAEGTLGMRTNATYTQFLPSDFHLTSVSTALARRLVPVLDSPIEAHVTGQVALDGMIDHLALRIDARVTPTRDPAFNVHANGGAGFGPVFTARALKLKSTDIPVSLVQTLGGHTPIGGVVDFDGVLDGSSAGALTGTFAVAHREGGEHSSAVVSGSVRVQDSVRMALDAKLETLSLALLRDFVDSLDVRGSVSGTVSVTGTPRNLASRFDIATPADGRVAGDAAYRGDGRNEAAYQGTMTLSHLEPGVMFGKWPAMSIDGTVTMNGTGTTVQTMRSTASARLALLMIDSTAVRNVVFDARTADGVLHVDSLRGATDFGSLNANGSFGLLSTTSGSLQVGAKVDDLRGLARWIATTDTSSIAARPAIAQRLTQIRDRVDSMRLARDAARDPAALLAASLNGNPAPPRDRRPITVPALARDSISGSFTIDGKMTGNVRVADAQATLRTPGMVWNGNLLGAGSVRASWMGAFTANDTVHIDGAVDSLRALGFAFDSTHFAGSYHAREGEAKLSLFPGDTALYEFDATYAFRAGGGEVRFRNIALKVDSAEWRSTRPSAINWRDDGLRVDSLDLRDAHSGGRLFLNGEMPDQGSGHFELFVDKLRLAPWLTITQSNLNADGLFAAHLNFSGTRKAPMFCGTLSVSQTRYQGGAFPDATADFSYQERLLTLDARALDSVRTTVAQVTGTMPVDLSFTGVTGSRLSDDGKLALVISGDRIPLSPLSDVTHAVSEVRGFAHGRVGIGGTWRTPALSGNLGFGLDQMRITSTKVLMNNVVGRMHMNVDTLVVDSMSALSVGRITGAGWVLLAPLNKPVLRLAFSSSGARLLNNDRGELFVDGSASVDGPLDSLMVTGDVALTHGVIRIPAPERWQVINTGDPAIFAVADSASVVALGIELPTIYERNLQADMHVEVRPGTFARSPQANVELSGRLHVRRNPGDAGYDVRGTLNTEQGSYTTFGKRFAVRRGAVRFVGGPELNPSLQVTATYDVVQAGRAPLEIRVDIGGTMDHPTIALDSDAKPPLSQSELLGFLAFGQSASSLLQFSSTGVEGGGSGSTLAGNVAALASRQLASMGLGALLDEARANLSAATRADVLTITPAQLPADANSGSFQTLLRGTELEIGRYVDARTFVLARVRPTFTFPGASLERRLSEQLRARAVLDTRYQAALPSLSVGVPPRTLQVFGALLTWTRAW